MQPLVLAIEPDLRQAAIVKRIVREKVQAAVTVVDSRDAALEAIRTTMPDVLLLSALLSPRDEAELIAHLRTLEDAQHLQTQTIPQLASTIDGGDEKPARGLLSAFRRRKESANTLAGCDPDLFADEIRTYLKRAEEKKRELREALAFGPIAKTDPIARPAADPSRDERAASTEATASSWASPFEWRPAASPTPTPGREAQSPVAAQTHVMASEPAVVVPESAIVVPEPAVVIPEASLDTPEPAILAFGSPLVREESDDVRLSEWPVAAAEPATSTEPVAAYQVDESFGASSADADEPAGAIEVPAIAEVEAAIPEYESTVVSFERAAIEPAPTLELARVEADVSIRRSRPPLVMRQARGWWFVEGNANAAAEPESELREVLASLTLPPTVAAVGYAEGCRIRRVRLTAA